MLDFPLEFWRNVVWLDLIYGSDWLKACSRASTLLNKQRDLIGSCGRGAWLMTCALYLGDIRRCKRTNWIWIRIWKLLLHYSFLFAAVFRWVPAFFCLVFMFTIHENMHLTWFSLYVFDYISTGCSCEQRCKMLMKVLLLILM